MAKPFHHGNLRQALMEATVALVGKSGAESLSLRAAARRAGVTHVAAYRHFPNKAALLAAVAEDGFARLRAAVDAVPAKGTALDRLHAIGRAYVQFALGHPAHYRLMYGPALSHRRAHRQLQAAARATFSSLLAVTVASQREGGMRAGEPVELALTAWALVHGLSQLILDGQLADAGIGPTRVTHMTETATAVLRAGLKRSH